MAKKMETQRQITEEVLDRLVERAIADLYQSGLNNEEIFLIVREQFGLQYAKKLCKESSQAN
jgi:hypothetical protein